MLRTWLGSEEQQPDCAWEMGTVCPSFRSHPPSQPLSSLPAPFLSPEEAPLSPGQRPHPSLQTKPKTACSERKDVNHRALYLEGTGPSCLLRLPCFVKYSHAAFENSALALSLYFFEDSNYAFSRERKKSSHFSSVGLLPSPEAAASSREGGFVAPPSRNNRALRNILVSRAKTGKLSVNGGYSSNALRGLEGGTD